jgi:ubiquinone/menaquinone biosynthesis C-methylase UbiE
MHAFFAHFGHPRGFLGRVAGTIMAVENRARNQWAVSLLDAQPQEHILEIGFGPGLAIRALAQTTAAAFIAGVDDSLVMVHQAGKRNAAAIRSGRVALQHSSVAHLPYPDATFHKVLAVNSLHHWPAPIANLSEVRRVLKPNGLVAIVEQPRGAATDEQMRVRADELATLLVAAGFQNIRQTFQPMRLAPSIGVLGMND